MNRAGMILKLKSGKVCQTFNHEVRVNGKLQVHLWTGEGEYDPEQRKPFAEKSVLTDPANVERLIGFTD
jgi:hypothetical protein